MAGFGVTTTARRLAGDIVMLSVNGELDLLTAPALENTITSLLTTEQPAGLVLDLSNVQFLSSAGLEVLVSTRRLAGSTTQVALVARSPAATRPITLTGVHDAVPLFATVEEAVAAITS